MTLHILVSDKFTIPFYNYITNVLNLKENQFLFLLDKKTELKSNKNLFYLLSPLKNNLFSNIRLFFKLCFNSNRIILHGDTLLPFFLIFPFFLKKTSWLIYGQELYSIDKENGFRLFVKKFVLSRVKNHITHIKGDSDLANKLLNSAANFVYSPIYLSNVVSTFEFSPIDVSQKKQLKILIGNSTDPTNNHESIFKRIIKFQEDIEFIFCPLSYGMYEDYKNRVKIVGTEMFGDKFIVIEHFMKFEEYKEFLNKMDIVIFDHNRQEAMGVTLTLLSLGKIIYLNPNTTSFVSLKERGFQIYDNTLIDNEGIKINRNVNQNKLLLNKYYSQEVFDDSLKSISKL